MGFIGFLLMLVCIGLLVFDPILEKLTDGKVDLLKGTKMKVLMAPLIILGFLMFLNPFVHNSSGERVYVLDPWVGTEKVEFEPGWHWGGFFHKSEAYPDVMSTVYGDEGIPRVPIRFNDATQGDAQANIRWELPKDEESMMALHKAYRSAEKLQTRTLAPYGQECLSFSAALMESEQHYSGGQSKLKEDFRDQLLNGQYVLETTIKYIPDTITGELIKTTEVHVRVDANKVPIRIPSDVQTYSIRAVFAAVPHVDYDEIVDEKLKAKIEASTRESIAKQELITAKQEAATEAAKGEQLIAKTRADEESAKLRAVIQAQKEKEVAREQAEQSKYIANKIEQEGRAEALANQLKVNAGLTPQERAEWDYKTKVEVAKALATWTPPNMVVGGGQGGVGSAMDAVSIKFLMDINDRITQSKKD